MNANIELVIQDLTSQVAALSREKAIYFALYTELKQQTEELKEEANTPEGDDAE